VHVVRVLLAAAAKLDSRIGGGALLSYAAEKGNVEVVKLLLAPRSSISLTQDEVGAALEDAIQNGHQEVVRFLTQTGIDLERRVNNYRTPLSVACTRETNDMVRLLIDLGASKETPYSDGKPLLPKVISEGRPNFNETVTLLLDKNASIEARDRSGSTPLITAVLYYCLDTVKLAFSKCGC
jgi:ankyrin repeat protein